MRHQSQNNNSRASVRPSQTTPRTTTAIRFAALCLLMAVASASGRPDEMTGAMYKFPPHTDPMPWLKRNKHHIEALLRWAKRLNKSIIKESWEDKRLRCRYMVRTIHREGPLGVFWNTVKYNDLCNYRDCKIYGESEQRQRYANKLLNDRWLQSDYYSIPGRNEKIFESEKKKLTEKFFVEKNFESEKKSGKSTIAGNQIILQIGQDIEANWKGKGKWYSAVVTDIEAEGKFRVRYKQDGVPESVTSDNIRALLPRLKSGDIVRVVLDNRKVTFHVGGKTASIILPKLSKPCDAEPACRFRQEYIDNEARPVWLKRKEALPKGNPGTDGYCATCECMGEVAAKISLGVSLYGGKVTLLP